MKRLFARGPFICLFVTGAVLAAPVGVLAASSRYTDFDTRECRHIPGKDAEDYGEWHCKGLQGIAVYMSAGDQRIYVSYGKNARNEKAALQTLASFNGEGRRIEWRLEKGKPFATIMRWRTTVTSDKGEPVRGSVLVVTRLGAGGVCHVGYVDGAANKNANALARRIADEHARNFVCGKDKPIMLGAQGSGFSGPYDAIE
jgi:hypothetical protein